MEANTNTLPASFDTSGFQIEEFKNIISTAPDILSKNKISVLNAEKAKGTCLEMYEKAAGMTENLDVQFFKTINIAKATEKKMNEMRKPFSQIMDALKKEFTSEEAKMKGIYVELQKYRDEYATVKAEEQRKQEAIARRKIEVENEKTECKRFFTIEYTASMERYLLACKEKLQEMFDQVTLETYEEKKNIIQTLTFEFNEAKMNAFLQKHSSAEFKFKYEENIAGGDVFIKSVYDELADKYLDEFAKKFVFEMEVKRNWLNDLFLSKKEELLTLANANEEKRKEIEAQVQARKTEAKAQEEARATEAVKATTEAANVAAMQQKTETFVDAAAEVMNNSTEKIKEGCTIQILNPVGYALLFQFWFDKEGLSMPCEKIEKMTIGRMKAFCEKTAGSTGEVIESEYILYQSKFSAK